MHAKHLCPFSDAAAFIEDVSSEVALKLTTKLHTYRFEQPLEHWVAAICKTSAYTSARKDPGRSEKGPRKFVSWEDLGEYSLSEAKPEHLDVLRRIFEEHRKEGKRAEKSAAAIQLYYFWGYEAKEIAERLSTTPGYVNKLISHDYVVLHKISVDKFGITGTKL